jgi:hypothetical protein
MDEAVTTRSRLSQAKVVRFASAVASAVASSPPRKHNHGPVSPSLLPSRASSSCEDTVFDSGVLDALARGKTTAIQGLLDLLDLEIFSTVHP